MNIAIFPTFDLTKVRKRKYWESNDDSNDDFGQSELSLGRDKIKIALYPRWKFFYPDYITNCIRKFYLSLIAFINHKSTQAKKKIYTENNKTLYNILFY